MLRSMFDPQITGITLSQLWCKAEFHEFITAKSMDCYRLPRWQPGNTLVNIIIDHFQSIDCNDDIARNQARLLGSPCFRHTEQRCSC